MHALFGPLRSITYGNGLTRSVGYDAAGRIESLQNGNAQSLSYGYDRCSRITDRVAGGG